MNISNFRTNYILRGLQALVSLPSLYFVSKSKFLKYGKNVLLIPPFSGGNKISFGDDVYIGPGAHLSTTNASIIFKSHISAGENLTIHTGNHARIVGLYHTDITEVNKPKGYDKDVVIEEDVWIGSRVTILSGVTIGRGSTIAAGAVITKDVPPYSVVGGVPGKFLRFQWSLEEIIEHERNIYKEDERLPMNYLTELFSKYSK